MGIIKAVNLIFDYIRHDEEKDQDEVNHALRGVDLDIAEGSFVAILGHNGSGKSTFAKLMNGLLLPSEWNGLYLGYAHQRLSPICGTSAARRAWCSRIRIIRSLETSSKRTWASGRKHGSSHGGDLGAGGRSLEAVGMTAYRLQSPNKLSGGQKQRVAIAGRYGDEAAVYCFGRADGDAGSQRTPGGDPDGS